MPIHIADPTEIEKKIEENKIKEHQKKNLPTSSNVDSYIKEILSLPDDSTPNIEKKLLIRGLKQKKMHKKVDEILSNEKNKILQMLQKNLVNTKENAENTITDPLYFIDEKCKIHINNKSSRIQEKKSELQTSNKPSTKTPIQLPLKNDKKIQQPLAYESNYNTRSKSLNHLAINNSSSHLNHVQASINNKDSFKQNDSNKLRNDSKSVDLSTKNLTSNSSHNSAYEEHKYPKKNYYNHYSRNNKYHHNRHHTRKENEKYSFRSEEERFPRKRPYENEYKNDYTYKKQKLSENHNNKLTDSKYSQHSKEYNNYKSSKSMQHIQKNHEKKYFNCSFTKNSSNERKKYEPAYDENFFSNNQEKNIPNKEILKDSTNILSNSNDKNNWKNISKEDSYKNNKYFSDSSKQSSNWTDSYSKNKQNSSTIIIKAIPKPYELESSSVNNQRSNTISIAKDTKKTLYILESPPARKQKMQRLSSASNKKIYTNGSKHPLEVTFTESFH